MTSQHIPLLIDVESLRRKAAARGFDLPTLIWDDVCSSTNDELAALVRGQSDLSAPASDRSRRVAAAEGIDLADVPAEFTVLGTDHQNAGHGRLGRTWTVPPRRSLTFSILLSPGAIFDSWGWIPLIAGEAVRAAIAEAGVPAVLKWPNDVLTEDGKKLCGILARVETLPTGPRIVLGMGINTRLERADLPRESASSIAIEKDTNGSEIDHEDLLVSILSTLIPAYGELVEYADDDFNRSTVGQQVRANMVTLGTRVKVERPDGTNLFGMATGLDSGGDLIIDHDVCVSAGDVHHLRPATEDTVAVQPEQTALSEGTDTKTGGSR